MATELEAATAALFATTDARLGDTVLYRAKGAPGFVEVVGYFDGGIDVDDGGRQRPTLSRPSFEVHVDSIPTPSGDDRLVISNRPDIYKPNKWDRTDDGSYWLIQLEVAR